VMGGHRGTAVVDVIWHVWVFPGYESAMPWFANTRRLKGVFPESYYRVESLRGGGRLRRHRRVVIVRRRLM